MVIFGHLDVPALASKAAAAYDKVTAQVEKAAIGFLTVSIECTNLGIVKNRNNKRLKIKTCQIRGAKVQGCRNVSSRLVFSLHKWGGTNKGFRWKDLLTQSGTAAWTNFKRDPFLTTNAATSVGPTFNLSPCLNSCT